MIRRPFPLPDPSAGATGSFARPALVVFLGTMIGYTGVSLGILAGHVLPAIREPLLREALGGLRAGAYNTWTGCAWLASGGLVDEMHVDCHISFQQPDLFPELLRGAAIALPVNLLAFLALAAIAHHLVRMDERP